jgi:hypothetical protein
MRQLHPPNWSQTAFPGRITYEKTLAMPNVRKSYDILMKTQVGMPISRCEEFFDNDDNFDLGESDIDGMLIWLAEKMGVTDATVAHA